MRIADLGIDTRPPVAEGIGIGRDVARFTGEILELTLEVADVEEGAARARPRLGESANTIRAATVGPPLRLRASNSSCR